MTWTVEFAAVSVSIYFQVFGYVSLLSLESKVKLHYCTYLITLRDTVALILLHLRDTVVLISTCALVFFAIDGRTVPRLDDLDMTFRDLGVNLHDLLDYVTEVEPSSLVIEVPQFPISAEKIRSQLNAEKNSAANKVRIKKQTGDQRLETEGTAVTSFFCIFALA